MHNKQILNKQSGYIKVPIEALKIRDKTALNIFIYLLNLPDDYCPTVKTLAKQLEFSKDSITKGMRYLTAHNILRKTQNYVIGVSATQYEFVPLEEWTLSKEQRL